MELGLSITCCPDCDHWQWAWVGEDFEYIDHDHHETILVAYKAAVRWAMVEAPDHISRTVCQVTHDISVH